MSITLCSLLWTATYSGASIYIASKFRSNISVIRMAFYNKINTTTKYKLLHYFTKQKTNYTKMVHWLCLLSAIWSYIHVIKLFQYISLQNWNQNNHKYYIYIYKHLLQRKLASLDDHHYFYGILISTKKIQVWQVQITFVLICNK
jgi:hypothetical protein